MTSTRFADRNVQDCGAWKERVFQEEKQARFQREARVSPRGHHAWMDSEGNAAYALPHPVTAPRPPRHRNQHPESSGMLTNSRGPTSYGQSEVSSYSGNGRYRKESSAGSHGNSSISRGLKEVNSRLERLETTLEAERKGRKGVQKELRELRTMLARTGNPRPISLGEAGGSALEATGRSKGSSRSRASDSSTLFTESSRLPRLT
eukprot:Hpha_TRINITY_DN14153_c0_g2::TRINITY_DN14153_c0_g2_i1::g.10910::m.10910